MGKTLPSIHSKSRFQPAITHSRTTPAANWDISANLAQNPTKSVPRRLPTSVPFCSILFHFHPFFTSPLHIRGAASPNPGGFGFFPTCVLKLCRYDTHIIDKPKL